MGMSRIRSWTPSPAMLIAVIALFVALGGTGYAARQLASTPPHHKKKTTHSDAAQDIALIKKQAAKLRGPTGLTGLRGPQGTQGDRGAQGPAGTALAFAHVLSSGTVDGGQT